MTIKTEISGRWKQLTPKWGKLWRGVNLRRAIQLTVTALCLLVTSRFMTTCSHTLSPLLMNIWEIQLTDFLPSCVQPRQINKCFVFVCVYQLHLVYSLYVIHTLISLKLNVINFFYKTNFGLLSFEEKCKTNDVQGPFLL